MWDLMQDLGAGPNGRSWRGALWAEIFWRQRVQSTCYDRGRAQKQCSTNTRIEYIC